jgi:hypothetical protein
MNISKWAYDGTPNYPVKIENVAEGRVKLTSLALKGKEWFGESDSAVLKTFNTDMQQEYDRMHFDSQPKWMDEMKKGEWL